MPDLQLLKKVVKAINHTPGPLRRRALSLALGKLVPYVGTSQLVIEEMTETRCVVVARNLRPVRNHIGQVHAVAMSLAVETATGFVTAMNLAPGTLPLIKSLEVQYKKRTKGDIRAVATLTSDQRREISTSERGNLEVEVHVTDATGDEPIQCTAIWAWVSRKKR